MDIAWKSICETISLSGPHGISWDQFKLELAHVMKLNETQLKWPPGPELEYLLSIYAGRIKDYSIGKFSSSDKFKKDLKTKLIFFVDLRPINDFRSIHDPTEIRFYCTNPAVRHSNLFQGRPIQLSESSLQVLEIIAAHGQNGLTQAELAKVLGCDSKNVFHWLKGLISNDLIARTPVASKKSFTYLLTLTRYLDEDISPLIDDIGKHRTIVVSSKEIRQMIVDILAKAPGQTMVSKDVFAQAGLDRLLIKHFRRAATKLNEIGWLEYLFEDQLVGPYCRLFRLKRKPSEGLDLNSFLASMEKIKNQENVQESSFKARGSDFCPDKPIIHQIILLLSRSFPEPLTTTQLSHQLNIPRKYLYKLIERIFPNTMKRSGVIGAEGIEKVTDFVGKEKRLLLFVKTEEWRDFYVNLFLNDESVSQNQTPSVSRPITPSNVSSTQIQSPSDTRTRQLRHQAILNELSSRKVLEIGKELCHRIQEILGDNRFTLDVKTLRRSVEILERNGQLKVVVASVPQGTRTLLISSELSASDEIVQNYISKMNEFVRSGPLSANTLRMNRLKESMQDIDYFVDGSLPLGVPQNPSVNSKALIQFGFVHGPMSRAQLFHEYLLLKSKDESFETIPTIFDEIPFGLYLKLIGIVRMSRGLWGSFENFKSISLESLPETYREELALNRKRFQSQAAILLAILEQLKLIKGEEQFSSLNFRLPFKYNLAKQVPIYNYKGEVDKIIKFIGNPEAFNEFWSGMQQICTNYHSRHYSIYESTEDEISAQIPKPILLARYPDSWKQKPSRDRDLERAVRRLAIETFTLEKSKKRRGNDNSEIYNEIETKISSLSSEYEIPTTRIQTMLENFVRLLEEREEAKRLDKLASRQKQSEEDYEDESETDEDELEHLRWTPSDWSKLSLAFCILLQPIFLSNYASTSTISGIKWNLAAKIFDKPKSPVVVRRHGLKLFKNYNELRKMLELDTIVQLVIRNFDSLIEEVSDDQGALFKSIFDACLRFESENEELFDNFRNVSEGNTEFCTVLSSRQELFLNTIDTWVQTRSFRHGLFLNNPGLVFEIDKVQEEFTHESCHRLLLRQILVTSFTSENLDYDEMSDIIKSIDTKELSAAIDRLLKIGFASKNRVRDKSRLFAFPLVVSESVRDVIEDTKKDFEIVNRLVVDCDTETLTINRIEGIIDSCLQGTTKININYGCGNSKKFDSPIEIISNDTKHSSVISYETLKSELKAIWFTPTSIFIPEVANGCLNHLTTSIKSHPGIPIETLKTRYFSVLEEFEVDSLVKCLVEEGRVEMVHFKYLQ